LSGARCLYLPIPETLKHCLADLGIAIIASSTTNFMGGMKKGKVGGDNLRGGVGITPTCREITFFP